jgi:glycosyltransferase involved in cell wall biosynthesis
MIGKMNEFKDMSNILNVLEKEKYDNLSFFFICKNISMYFKNFENRRNNNINIWDEYIDTAVYAKEIESADFLLLPYKNSYGNRCSAAFLDSLMLGTPVIASTLPCFKSLIDRYHCGVAYANHLELNNILNNINNNELRINIADTLYEDFSFDNSKRLFHQFVYDDAPHFAVFSGRCSETKASEQP